MAAVSADRLTSIRYWWAWVYHGFAYPPSLCEAFVDVLARLSDEAFGRFLKYFPIVLSLNGRLGCTFRPNHLPDWPVPDRRPAILCFFPDSAEQTPRGLVALVAHEVGHVVLDHVGEGNRKPYAQQEAEVAEFLAGLGIQEPDWFEMRDNYGRLRAVERDLRIVLTNLDFAEGPEVDIRVLTARARLGMAIAELHMTLSHYPVPACTRKPEGIVRTAVLADDESPLNSADPTRPIRIAVRE